MHFISNVKKNQILRLGSLWPHKVELACKVSRKSVIWSKMVMRILERQPLDSLADAGR